MAPAHRRQLLFFTGAVRLSNKRIETLQVLLEELTGHEYTHEQAQEAGLQIMRFVIAKAQRDSKLNTEEKNEKRIAKAA